MKKIETWQITATIVCERGTRIGGSNDLLQIGGVDLTCIKHPGTFQPYLPGSSLKGKMRSELEKQEGKFGGRDNAEPCGCGREDCLICRIFGPHKNTKHSLGPSRIIVRDALPLGEIKMENKTESTINRQSGSAQNPRIAERVAAGGKFGLEILLQVWDIDSNMQYNGKTGGAALRNFVLQGLALVESTGIGAGVSKGYGKISLSDKDLQKLKLDSLDDWTTR